MRTNLAEDPAVIRLANEIELDTGLGPGLTLSQRRSLVIGCLHRLWSWFRDRTENGRVTGIPAEHIDHIVGIGGFARLLQKVKWLRVSKRGVCAPNWERWNSKDARKRMLAANRMLRSRCAGRDAARTAAGLHDDDDDPTRHHTHPGARASATGRRSDSYSEACRRLEAEGVGRVAIRSLGLDLTLERVQTAIANADAAKSIKNRPGYLVEAIRSGFDLSKPAKKRQAESEAQRAREKAAAAEQAAWAPFWNWWRGLTHEERVEAVRKATEKMAAEHHRDAFEEVERNDRICNYTAKAVRKQWEATNV